MELLLIAAVHFKIEKLMTTNKNFGRKEGGLSKHFTKISIEGNSQYFKSYFSKYNAARLRLTDWNVM